MSYADSDILLGEFDVRVANVETTVFVTSHSSSVTAGGNPYLPYFAAPFSGLARYMFSPFSTRGQSPPAAGEVSLFNTEGALDKYKRAQFDVRRAVVRRGQLTDVANYLSWRVLLDGAMAPAEFTPENANAPTQVVTLHVRDARKFADVPFESETYLGDNVDGEGIEGTEDDLKGKTKANGLGVSFNVPLVPVNDTKNIYHASNTELLSIVVRDRGYALIGSPRVWTAIAHGLGWTEILCNATNGTRIVIGGANGSTGHVATSDDNGASWTQRTITSAGKVVGVAYGEPSGTPTWVAVTLLDGIETSGDATTWAQQRVESGSRQTEQVRWIEQEQLFFIVGDQQRIFTSATCASGTLTTQRNAGAGSIRVRDVAAINGYVVAGTNTGVLYRMASGSLGTQTVFTIDDATGANWAAATTTGGVMYVAGLIGLMYTSRDGIAFTKRETGLPLVGGLQPNILDLGGFNGYAVAACSGGYLSLSRDQGVTWETASFAGVTNDLNCVLATPDDRWIVGSSGADLGKSSGAITYASAADLEDDDQAPEHSNYGVFLDASGSYVRLGSPADGLVTGDLIEGATSADRTHGQLFVKTMTRAGKSVSANLVTSPSALATGWSTSGTVTPTNSALTRYGHTFSRIATPSTGGVFRTVALTGNAKKIVQAVIRSDGSDGHSYFGLWDNTTSVWLAIAKYTITNGVVTATATGFTGAAGTGLTVKRVRPGIYVVTLLSATATAANTNHVYANSYDGTGTLTSVLVSSVRVSDATVKDDWSAFDVVALDAAQPSEAGVWIGPDENPPCGEILNRIADSCGASVFADQDGEIRIVRLEAPSTNLVTNPSSLATSPWANAGGTAAATNAVSVVNGRSYSRISNANNGFWAQPLVLGGDGTYYLTYYIKRDASNGTLQTVWSDGTAGVNRANVVATIAANGSISINVGNGTLVRFVAVNGGLGDYAIVIKATGVIAANANQLIATYGPGSSATNVLLSEFIVVEGEPDITVEQNDLAANLAPMPSADANGGIPPYRTTVRWGKNYAVQASDLAADTSEGLRPQLAREYREAISEDADVLVRHPTSQPVVIDSLFAFASDAQDEADRWETLMALELQWYQATVEITTDTGHASPALVANADTIDQLELNGIYEQVHSRYGLGAGRRFRVMGVQPTTEPANNRVVFNLYG